MRRAALFLALASALSGACHSESRAQGDGVVSGPGSATGSEDDAGSISPSSSADSSTPGSTSDAATPNGQADASKGLVDQVGEYLTCKPDELNPILDCLTVKCTMKLDPISFASCIADDCAKLVEKVSPKCRDCVVAGIAQDTAGLVQDCLDTSPILGDGGTLPF